MRTIAAVAIAFVLSACGPKCIKSHQVKKVEPEFIYLMPIGAVLIPMVMPERTITVDVCDEYEGTH